MNVNRPWRWSVCLLFLAFCRSGACFQRSERSHHHGINRQASLPARVTASQSDENVDSLKQEFLRLAERTDRGFKASTKDQADAKRLMNRLGRWNPTTEPAASYYPKDKRDERSSQQEGASLVGKWTLIYTDAPDITALTDNPLADLGRIGQECSPPLIKNVIEWKRPAWAVSLPFSGAENSRVIQKVSIVGSASPERPTIVNLTAKGVEIDASGMDGSPLTTLIQANPLSNLQGPFALPFGQFQVLYLDHELRVVRTGQGYYAANARVSLLDRQQEWF